MLVSVNLKELANLFFTLSLRPRDVFCANAIFLLRNFCTHAVTVFMEKASLMCSLAPSNTFLAWKLGVQKRCKNQI